MLKRTMRQVWIKRINAGVRRFSDSTPGLTYSTFIHKMGQAACRVNRKSLAQLASLEPRLFTHLLQITYG
jgi:ribosomal protein L20